MAERERGERRGKGEGRGFRRRGMGRRKVCRFCADKSMLIDYKDARVLGTDFSSLVIAEARRRQPGVEFEVCSVYDCASLGRFDLVVACEVMEHLEHPDRALRAIQLAASGYVLATVPREPLWRVLNVLRGRYWGALGNTDGHLQHWSRGSFQRFLATQLDVVDVRSPLPWTQVLARPRPMAHA